MVLILCRFVKWVGLNVIRGISLVAMLIRILIDCDNGTMCFLRRSVEFQFDAHVEFEIFWGYLLCDKKFDLV